MPDGREQRERFQRLLGDLENLLDSGFFISLLGRVVIDEKRAFSVLNELRAIDIAPVEHKKEPKKAPEMPRMPEGADESLRKAYADAESVRRGADEYALKTLEEIEEILEKKLVTIKEGLRVLRDRIERSKSS